MLDRTFLRAFFEQLDSMSDADLEKKIAEVESVKRACTRGGEAEADARYMLKHMLRVRLERVFKP